MDKIDEEDRLLFRRSVGEVTPLQIEQAVLPRKKPSPWRLRKNTRDGEDALTEWPSGWAIPSRPPWGAPHGNPLLADWSDQLELETAEAGDVLRYSQAGVQPKWLLRLRRGELPVEAELDLHGATVEKTRRGLVVFLTNAVTRGLRCVRIIHGKGYRSTQTPVLKNKLNLWLRQTPHVLAFCSAPPGGGGTGAVLVLLRRSSV
ncbi:MAG TPA: Smr/MutS family protein [Methylococcaceae bacterium]|nr:Smr/MutS family protein [Methylococcaceae bacterium]